MASARRLRIVLALGASVSTGLAAACARQGAPPGGPEDRRPPVVVATEPEPFAVLEEPFRGPVRFHFDERVSERVSGGSLNEAVLVSPRTGEVRVSHGRQGISVDVSGGFRPGLVYRVTLLPVVRDLFNNQMRDPVDLVFSTGGELVPSAVAGMVWDRSTGEPMEALDVVALQPSEEGDTLAYPARTDTGGVYVFRYLPPGRYNVLAFEDRNRNGLVDRMEMQGSRGMLLGGPDTAILDIGVLQPDTTPARLIRVTALDSITVLLDFDDYLDPAVSAAQMAVVVSREEGESPGVDVAFHEPQYVAWRQAVQDSFAHMDSVAAAARTLEQRRARAQEGDSAAPPPTVAPDTTRRPPPARRPGAPAEDTTTSDTTRAAAGPKRALPPELPAGPPGSGGAPSMRPGAGREEGPPLNPEGQPLPARRAVLRMAGPIEVNVGYKLTVTGVVNLNGLPLGGGEAALVREPPKDTTTAGDSAVVRDSLPPDTAVIPPDTSRVPPDTALVPPDTGSVARSRVFFLPGRRR